MCPSALPPGPLQFLCVFLGTPQVGSWPLPQANWEEWPVSQAVIYQIDCCWREERAGSGVGGILALIFSFKRYQLSVSSEILIST